MTLAWLLAAMQLLAPNRDHVELATAIATVVADSPPLFADDDDKRKTAALLVAMTFRESSFRNAAISKQGDFCAMQINRTSGGSKELTEDAELCIRKGMEMLRQSFRICPEYPLAWYAIGGTQACTNERGRRISRDRAWLAKKLLREVVQ